MQDWSHIPIHIRCSERWKIDPSYPQDGCAWWRVQGKRPEYKHPVKGFLDRTTDEQYKLLAYIREHGPVTVKDIRRDLGIPSAISSAMIDGISKIAPVYHEMIDRMYYYNILGDE